MVELKITFYTNKDRTYSYKELLDESEFTEKDIGIFNEPFPNEEDCSLAFGLVECFEQSDDNFLDWGEKIVKVVIEKI